MKGEIWKDIEGYEGLYQVSNMGNVKSLNYNHTGKEKILKGIDTGIGYLQLHLCKDGKRKNYFVHQLVATAFCENQEGYTEVNHINEDKSDNRADNLEWCSRQYNVEYSKAKATVGINKVSGLILEFPSAREASRILGIDPSSITKCCKGKRKSIGGYYWHYVENDSYNHYISQND